MRQLTTSVNIVPTEGGKRWWALGFVLAGNLTVFASVTMINVALPEAQQALGLGEASRASVVTLNRPRFSAATLRVRALG